MCLSRVLAWSVFIFVTAKCALRTDQDYWKDLAKSELAEALQVKWNTNTARSVVLFVGDGMGPNTVTAARIHKGGETHRLSFEKFPHVGLLKTYSANKMVPDSSCAATALFCGVKANQETIGVDATVQQNDCEASLKPEARLRSLAALALAAGKSAGFVTTMRVTHATPGPLYAHSASRKWECDSKMPAGSRCKDIGRQLVEDWPGKDLHVILGGGRQVLMANSTATASDPIDTWSGVRKDGRNLIEDYRTDKASRGLKHSVVFNNKELKNMNVDETDYLLGIFANGHLQYEHERDTSPDGMPSISDMVEAAIKVLSKNKNGFFLMVEGGNIDMAHHRGKAKKAVTEAAAMEDAVQVALAMTDDQDTLLIVTSDHTHTLSINGYPYRGTNIFGLSQQAQVDGTNYTTLSYSTGGPGSFHFYTDSNHSEVRREEPREPNSYEYQQVAAITLAENSHGGGDVAIYAKGPQAHLFHNVHEQHYVYHAVSYAAAMGAYSCARAAQPHTYAFIAVVFFLALVGRR